MPESDSDLEGGTAAPGYPGPRRPMMAAQLRFADESAHRALYAFLHDRGFDDLRPSHLDLFRFPGPHGRTPTQLAAHMGMTKQALHPLLNDLQAAGYLRRVPDPCDGRGRMLELTERGLALVAAIRESLEQLETAVEQRVGTRAYGQFIDTLSAIRDLDPTD